MKQRIYEAPRTFKARYHEIGREANDIKEFNARRTFEGEAKDIKEFNARRTFEGKKAADDAHLKDDIMRSDVKQRL